MAQEAGAEAHVQDQLACLFPIPEVTREKGRDQEAHLDPLNREDDPFPLIGSVTLGLRGLLHHQEGSHHAALVLL